MRSFAVLSAAAGLVAAQELTSIVITDGVTATITLPVFPEPTTTVVATVPETTVTVSPSAESPASSASTTVTVTAGTSTIESGLTTTTLVVVPSLSSDPVITLPSFTESPVDPATTITEATPVVPPVETTTLLTSIGTATHFPNATATTTGPVVVPTAAADKVKGSAAGLVAFGIASFFLL